MHSREVTLDRMRTFIRVADRGNLSAVGRELGLGQSTITRHISDLEHALGVSLFSRTTRSISLTEEGRLFYARATEILRMVDHAHEELEDKKTGTAGRVRVACSAFFGVTHLSRLIFVFQDRYPEILVDLVVSDERTDLVREGIDIAIQIGPQSDSELLARPLGESSQILVASPQYLSRRGTPRVPDDLSAHDVIRRTNIPKSDELTLIDDQGNTHTAPITPRLRVDHGLAAREALIANRGIAPVPQWLVDDLLTAGDLAPVLPGYSCPPAPLFMLIVPERAEVTRVQLMRDHLARRITGIPGGTAPGSR